MNNTIDAEIVPPENPMALAVRQAQPVGLFGASEPTAVVERATSVANALKDVIVKQKLVSRISGKEYPRCEAWTLLGTMLGVFPVTVWTKEVEGGWEARVEARTKDGAVIGAAEAQCLRAERNWANRDDFALRSMAQTRATAKCLRMPLGFVMTLAGFEATPAEEMVSDHPQESRARGLGRPSEAPRQNPATMSQPKAQSPSQPPQQAAAPAKQTEPAKRLYPTEATRKWLLNQLKDCIPLATEFFQKIDSPAVLMPNETLKDLPLSWCPVTAQQMAALQEALAAFGNGEEAKHPYPQNPTKVPEPAMKKPEAKPKPAAAAAPTSPAPKDRDPEWFFDVIVPVPPKGVKRDEYLKSPDTIGTLYYRTKEGDQDAGRRLFGFVGHFEAKPWIGRDGNQRPPSQTDVKFREALDAFGDWHEKNGQKPVQSPAQGQRGFERVMSGPRGEAAQESLEREANEELDRIFGDEEDPNA